MKLIAALQTGLQFGWACRSSSLCLVILVARGVLALSMVGWEVHFNPAYAKPLDLTVRAV